jgi:hypothetical protein
MSIRRIGMSEYEASLEPELGRRPRLRQMLDAARQSAGPLTDIQFEEILPTSEWRTDKGKPFKAPDMEVRTLRRRLAELGLIQPAGATATGAARWKATPTGKAEDAARRFTNAQKRRRKSRRERSPLATLAEMRRTIEGDWTQWQKTRRTMLTLGAALEAVEPMAFWLCAPEDEREWVHNEIADLVQWGQNALLAFEQRQADDKIRDKIAKLTENTKGRTDAEKAAARGRAAALRAKL